MRDEHSFIIKAPESEYENIEAIRLGTEGRIVYGNTSKACSQSDNGFTVAMTPSGRVVALLSFKRGKSRLVPSAELTGLAVDKGLSSSEAKVIAAASLLGLLRGIRAATGKRNYLYADNVSGDQWFAGVLDEQGWVPVGNRGPIRRWVKFAEETSVKKRKK